MILFFYLFNVLYYNVCATRECFFDNAKEEVASSDSYFLIKVT